MKIVLGPASRGLGQKIGDTLGAPIVPVDFKRFPDGESYLRLTEEVEGEDVVIVQTTCPPQDSNLVQLLLLADAARDLGAKSVAAVIPYIAYGRQEQRFRSGEAVSANTVFKLLREVDISSLVTVDFHSPELLESSGIRFANVSAIPSLAKFLKERYKLDGAFSLAPDEGAKEFVKVTAKIMNGDYGWLEKTRDKVSGEVTFELKALNVRDRDAVVFDDIISSGSTMIHAVKSLKEMGAKRTFAACTHPLLIGDAKEQILAMGAQEIVGTDAIQSSMGLVSIAPVVADVLRKWYTLDSRDEKY